VRPAIFIEMDQIVCCFLPAVAGHASTSFLPGDLGISLLGDAEERQDSLDQVAQSTHLILFERTVIVAGILRNDILNDTLKCAFDVAFFPVISSVVALHGTKNGVASMVTVAGEMESS